MFVQVFRVVGEVHSGVCEKNAHPTQQAIIAYEDPEPPSSMLAQGHHGLARADGRFFFSQTQIPLSRPSTQH